MRLRKLTIGLTLILLASGVFAAPALAKDPSVSSLKQRLQHAKHKRDRAHERVVAAAANLAGARELLAATGGNQSAPAPATTPDPTATDTAVNGLTVPAGMSPELAAALLADGVVTADEIAGLQARLTAAKRVDSAMPEPRATHPLRPPASAAYSQRYRPGSRRPRPSAAGRPLQDCRCRWPAPVA